MMWLTTAEFARLVGISDRKALAAIRRSFRFGKSWRGVTLSVRLAPGRGGPGGMRHAA
jgi:hypothetical protein